MRLGGPVFIASNDPADLAAEYVRLGYRAAFCPPLSLEDTQTIRATSEAFNRAGIVIAEVGVWNNMLDPNESLRRQNREHVAEQLSLADEVGALCCVNIAGSRNPARWDGPHPDNLSQETFDLIVENTRYVLDTAKPRRARFALEMMPWALPDGPDECLRLLKAVERPMFAVHLDPANLVNSPRRYYDTGALLRDCFGKLGPHIVSCHAKDTLMRDDLTVHIDEVRPGLGALDYRVYLAELARLVPESPLMMEHLASPEEYDLAAAYIREVAAEVGARL